MHLTLEWVQGTVSLKGFVSCVVSVATTQLCHWSTNTGVDSTETNGCGCANKTLFTKTGGGLDLAPGR